MTRILTSLLVLVLLQATGRAQLTVHVDQTFVGTSDGSAAAPFTTIQQGLDAALDGDTVLVQPGAYFEYLNWPNRTLSLESAQGPAVTSIVATPTSSGGVHLISGPTTGYQRLEGFTLAGQQGARPELRLSQPLGEVVDCRLLDVYLFAIGVFQHLTFERCEFANMVTAHVTPGTFALPGWGWLRFLGCHFHDVAYPYDDPYHPPFPPPEFKVNVFELQACRLENVGWIFGDTGATLVSVGDSSFSSSASPFGTANGQTWISGCSFLDSPLGISGVGFVTDSIVWSSDPTPLVLPGTTLYGCNVKGGWAGPGGSNIDVDPMFVDAANGDLHLLAGSPMIDIGGRLSSFDVRADIDGDDRQIGRYVDLGADEFDSGPFALAGTRDDLALDTFVNGQRVNAAGVAVMPGDLVELLVAVGGADWGFVRGELFAAGGSPILPAGHPAVHLDLANSQLLQVVGSGSTTLSGVVPGGFSGQVYRIQAFALSTYAANGWYAASDAVDLVHP